MFSFKKSDAKKFEDDEAMVDMLLTEKIMIVERMIQRGFVPSPKVVCRTLTIGEKQRKIELIELFHSCGVSLDAKVALNISN